LHSFGRPPTKNKQTKPNPPICSLHAQLSDQKSDEARLGEKVTRAAGALQAASQNGQNASYPDGSDVEEAALARARREIAGLKSAAESEKARLQFQADKIRTAVGAPVNVLRRMSDATVVAEAFALPAESLRRPPSNLNQGDNPDRVPAALMTIARSMLGIVVVDTNRQASRCLAIASDEKTPVRIWSIEQIAKKRAQPPPLSLRRDADALRLQQMFPDAIARALDAVTCREDRLQPVVARVFDKWWLCDSRQTQQALCEEAAKMSPQFRRTFRCICIADQTM
jgi:chromosome segregation ATPase